MSTSSRAAVSSEGGSGRRKVWWVVSLVAAVALVAAAFVTLFAPEEGAAPGSEPRREATALGVEVTAAARSDLQVTTSYHGELWTEVAELAAQQTGRLELVNAKLGERFKAGALLARVDALQLRRQIDEAVAQVSAARAEERRIEAERAAARVELARGERLLKERLIASQEIDALRARQAVLQAQSQAAEAQRQQSAARVALLRQQLSEASLRAPFDGAVAERYLDAGALVQPGTPVLRLVKSGPLRVRFRIPERDLLRVAVGQEVEVSTQVTGERRFRGEVTQLSAEVSRRDRMLAVEATLAEESEPLRAGMHAEVVVTLQELTGAVVVPPAALVERSVEGQRELGVYVVEGEVARYHVVTVRGRSGTQTAVEGLEVGAQVVTLGQAKLRDGAAVNVVAAAANAGAAGGS